MKIELSKMTELKNAGVIQQINFIARFDRDRGAIIFFTIENSEESTFNFYKTL